MSIVRWGEDGSHVYIIGTEANGVDIWECVGCDGPHNFVPDRKEFAQHLRWHRDQGDVVPSWIESTLEKYDEDA